MITVKYEPKRHLTSNKYTIPKAKSRGWGQGDFNPVLMETKHGVEDGRGQKLQLFTYK